MKFGSKHFLIWSLVLVSILYSVSAQEMVTEQLVGFWSFDQSTIAGKSVRDVWAKNHGAIKGTPQIVDGRIGQALSFKGKTDLVEIPHHANLDLKKEVTIEFWFLLKGQSGNNEYPRPVSKGQSTGDNSGYGVWVRDSRNPTDIGFRSVTLIPKDTRKTGLPNYNNKDWHHVVLAYNGKKGMLYLDGEVLVDQPVKGDLSQNKEPLHIGDGNNERHFNGLIDEVRIYSRGLSQVEVTQNFKVESNLLDVQPAGKIATL